MEESKTIHLLCELTQAGSLQQICDLACQITGNPVFVSDLAHTILAYTKCVDVPDETWQANVVHAQLGRNVMNQNRDVGSIHTSVEAEKRPVVVSDDYLPYPHIIKTLVHDHKAVGVMVLTACLKPLEEHDVDLVELISSFAVSCLRRGRFHTSDKRNSVENYFIKLLDGEGYSRDQIDKRLDMLGYHPKAYTYVLALCNDDRAANHSEGVLSQIRQDISEVLRCPVLFYNTLLLCVYGCDRPVKYWPEDVAGMEELLDKWGLLCGVSRRLTHMEKLRDHYQQAQAALDKGRRLDHGQKCYRFDSIASYLLLDRVPQGELDDYCHEQVQRLWAYDREHGTELCITLQVYLEQAKSLAKTAEVLFVHRNTVRYRIKRCMELLEDELVDGNEIFAFILSLRIREYRLKLCDEKPNRFAGRSTAERDLKKES